MDYDELYRRTPHLFGQEPEEILRSYVHRISRLAAVLDVGTGQGRNALFLGREGFVVDAIDLSEVAVEIVSAAARAEDLAIRTHRCGFETFAPKIPYSAIVLFGIIQELSWESISSLLEKTDLWSRKGTLLFATAFTTDDPAFGKHSKTWTMIGENSFADGEGAIRTYLKSGEMLSLFHKWKAIYYWEGLGPEHRHGDAPPEHHAKVEAVFERRHLAITDRLLMAAEHEPMPTA
jgi:tellurite methyltransferase